MQQCRRQMVIRGSNKPVMMREERRICKCKLCVRGPEKPSGAKNRSSEQQGCALRRYRFQSRDQFVLESQRGAAESGSWNSFIRNQRQEEFLQSFALPDSQSVQMNSHLIPGKNARDRACADHRPHTMR